MKDFENLSDYAAEKIINVLIEDDEEDAALELIKFLGTSVIVANDGNCELEYPHCTSLEEAAKEYVDSGDWGDESSTDWVDVHAWRRWTLGSVVIDEDSETFTIEIEPKEPACSGDEHDWCSPHSVVGGIEENPGVWANGGGVIINEVCRHCGCLKTTDTWAQKGAEQGYTSVAYDNGNHSCRDAWEKWVEED